MLCHIVPCWIAVALTVGKDPLRELISGDIAYTTGCLDSHWTPHLYTHDPPKIPSPTSTQTFCSAHMLLSSMIDDHVLTLGSTLEEIKGLNKATQQLLQTLLERLGLAPALNVQALFHYTPPIPTSAGWRKISLKPSPPSDCYVLVAGRVRVGSGTSEGRRGREDMASTYRLRPCSTRSPISDERTEVKGAERC